MHRNVTRLVPRTRRFALREATLYSQQCKNYSFFDRVNPFSRSPSKDSEEATTTTASAANDDDKNPVDISLVDRDPEELKRLLQQLDQKALVDTKTKLQELSVRIEGLRTSVPGLFPKTMALETWTSKSKKKSKKKDTEKGGRSSGKDAAASSLPPYILAHNRTMLADLPTPLTRATTQISHLIAHISDLQTEDYRPGDRLAGWKEEIAGMSRGQKEEKLMELQYEEEAMMARMVVEARKNLGVVEGLVGVAREGEGERERAAGKTEGGAGVGQTKGKAGEGKTEGRAGRRQRERQKQREKGEGKRGERERVLRIGQSRAEAAEKERGKTDGGEESGKGKEKGKENSTAWDKSLSELQASLNANYNKSSIEHK